MKYHFYGVMKVDKFLEILLSSFMEVTSILEYFLIGLWKWANVLIQLG